MAWKVPKIWDGGDCWIIGGGPSMPHQFGVPDELIKKVQSGKLLPSTYSKYMEPIHDKHVIGINAAYLIGNWIDIVFFGDKRWFLENEYRLASFPNLKVGCKSYFAKRDLKYLGVKYIPLNKKHSEGISNEKYTVSWNQNSGAAAISLAHHLGVKRIFLLGFDMKKVGENKHWHGLYTPVNGKPVVQTPFKRHLEGFPAISTDAKYLGIDIYNVSPESAINVLPKISLKAAFKIAGI
jgi:hypothetical protein